MIFVLGPPNDLITVLRKLSKTKAIMNKFIEDMKWRPEGRGGKFAGPTMRLFLEQYCVELGTRLESVSPRLAKQVVEYCQSLWTLYKVSVAKELVNNWKFFTDDYTKKFQVLHRRIGLMDTLKQHIIVTHVPEYFALHGVTLRASSEEYLESTHSVLRMMEERSRLRTTGRKRGTVTHQERLLRSSYLFNFSRLGFLPHQYEKDNNVDDVPMPPTPPSHHEDHSYCRKVIHDFYQT